MLRPYEQGQRYQKQTVNVGLQYREKPGIHVYYDEPYFYDSGLYHTYFVSPVLPFVGLSFAVLVRYDQGYKLFNMGFGHHEKGKGIIEMFHYDDIFGVHSWDYAQGTIFDSEGYKVTTKCELNLNDLIWFELRIETEGVISGWVNGKQMARNEHSTTQLINKLNPYVKFHNNVNQFCSLWEMHFTTFSLSGTNDLLNPAIQAKLFEAYDRQNKKQPLKALFNQREGTYMREGGSVTLIGRNTEQTPSEGIEVGLSDENNVDHVSVTLKTALNKLKNVIILQKGFGEALCYCNDERHSLQRNGDQRDWFFIKKNCEPTDIVIHTGHFDTIAGDYFDK